jgi:ABC-type maltose transport system permease subunit
MTTRITARRGAPRTGQVVANPGVRTALRLVVVVLGTIFALYPFLIIIGTSFDPANSLSSARLIPANPSLINYEKLFASDQTPIFRWLANSIFVSVTSTLVTLALTTLAAYSFSRFRFRGRETALLGTLIIQVFPTVIALVAFFLLLQQVGEIIPFFGLNSLGGLILIYTGGALGANAYLMKGYFDTIPREIDESAQVDGATHWVTFTRIVLPLIRPILAIVGLLSFIGTFNDFLLPRVLLRDKEMYTLAVGLTTFLDNQFSRSWGVFAAGALIGTVPIIVMFLILQTQLVSGLSSGAVKG